MRRGICKLCLREKDLQESHLMPRALYRMARGSGTHGNQDPYLMTARGGRQSSHQTKDYVLCRECEQLFSRNGEDYTLRLLTKRNGQFPLMDVLASVAPTRAGRDWKAYALGDTPTVNRGKIAYFAISVFWRASVHTWDQEDGEKIRIRLGKKYNEELRKYLLGESPVPLNASLQVVVCSDLLNRMTFFLPQENQKVKDRSVVFLARGMLFFFRITNKLEDFQRRLSIVNEPHGWITMRDCGNRPVWALGESS